MPRGGKRNLKGGVRHFSSPEVIDQQLKEKATRRPDPVASGSDDSEGGSDAEGNPTASSDTKPKGLQHLIEVQNPNRAQAKTKKVSDLDKEMQPDVSRKEREAAEKERARQRYQELHAQGLTEQAQLDLARLALVRKERDEAAKKREDEKQAKEAAKQSRQVDAFKKLDKRAGSGGAGGTSGDAANQKRAGGGTKSKAGAAAGPGDGDGGHPEPNDDTAGNPDAMF